MSIFLLQIQCFSFPVRVFAQVPGPENVNIDGKLSEWTDPLPGYDKSTLLFYAVHNDRDFLYIALKRSKWGGKIGSDGRILFTIDGNGKDHLLKICYPARFYRPATELWNYMELNRVGSRNTDTLTIYNDYGIQAAGGFWTQAAAEEKTPAVQGADVELAIPLELLPVAADGYTIRISLRGDAESSAALPILTSLSRDRMPAEQQAQLRDQFTATTLTIKYSLN